ncbi:helix-turn-helix domain-containing protein [Faecalibacillus intestinalis]|uniref:helix-turn-helix domain-containing protein n=1 Tax=Faecalibacillus intestinalis TaxID=1982626 RepID=UPI0018A8C3F4|nr:helix-turn-helix transcriptional regulator [Faecalibacillus intestinalis]
MFSVRLKELREAYKLNQTELGEILGVTNQTVSNWENGNIAPSIEMVEKIANYFKVSVDYLLFRTDSLTIKVNNLTLEQIAHVQSIVNDIEELNRKIKKSSE